MVFLDHHRQVLALRAGGAGAAGSLYGARRGGGAGISRARDARDVRLRQGKRDHLLSVIVLARGDFVFYDCVYEELLQALGPINDTDAVPWTMFNDDVHMGFFDIYDQYLLNIRMIRASGRHGA